MSGCQEPGCDRAARHHYKLRWARTAAHGSPELPPRREDCAACGASLAGLPWTRRERLYCNDACRMVAQRRRGPQAPSEAVLELRAGWERTQALLTELRESMARAGLT